MKRTWELDELIEHFTIMPNEMSLVGNKAGETRLGFAVLLKFFQFEAKFPNSKNDVPKEVVKYIAKQLKQKVITFQNYDINSRTHYYHRTQIREFLGFREATVEDSNNLTEWLSKYVFYHDTDIDNLKEEAYSRLRELHIEPPTIDRIDRITKSAISIYEDQFFQETYLQLSQKTISQMDVLMDNLTSFNVTDIDNNIEEEDSISFNELRSDPGRIGLESLFKEVVKIRTIQQLELTDKLFNNIPAKVLKRYKQRAVSEKLGE